MAVTQMHREYNVVTCGALSIPKLTRPTRNFQIADGIYRDHKKAGQDVKLVTRTVSDWEDLES